MRRRNAIIAWGVVVVAVITLFLIWQYVGFRAARRTLPDGMTLAGVPAEGMTRDEVLNVLEVNFATPLDVYYADQQIPLAPETVGLVYNASQTAQNLEEVLRARGGLDGFMAFILNRPLGPVDVPVAVAFSEERLDAFLARVAAQYDSPPLAAVTVPENLAFRLSQPGYEMDLAASRDRLVRALTSATEHEVRLVVNVEEAPPESGDVLGQMIQFLFEDHQGLIAGIFIKDLATGEEWAFNEAVAYEGPGVLKVAVMKATYHALSLPLDPQVSEWLNDTIGTSDSNAAANLLLQNAIGGGDAASGAESVSAAMRYLGLINTFIAAPFDAGGTVPTISTPANSRADITTNPNPNVQTTPLDAGLLLEMIYQCSEGGGPLLVAFPERVTEPECIQMLDLLSRNQIDSFIEVGVPVGTRVAHKQGISASTHSDSAIVFGPQADFVLTVFLYRPNWLPWEESAPLISNIATATFNYFNPDYQMAPGS